MPDDPLLPGILTSLNTIKHGCRSQQQLLPHEDPKEYIRLRDTYMAEFNPQTTFLEELLDLAVRAHWILRRNETQLYRVQFDLPEDPRLWHPEDHHQIALFTRYQTAAERSFHRALARLRTYHKDQIQQDQKEQNQKEQESAKGALDAPVLRESLKGTKDMKAARAPKQAKEEPIVLEQWVEVRRVENKVVTQFFPSNEEVEQTIATASPKPTQVYRRLFFPDGVPTPYAWTRPRNGQAKNGGLAIQRMTVETWLTLRAEELETGHAVSAGKATLRDWRDGEPAEI